MIVEGDGSGKSKTEPLVENEPRVPRLYEIPRIVDAFRNAMVSVMGASRRRASLRSASSPIAGV